jgi:hypothetical protein
LSTSPLRHRLDVEVGRHRRDDRLKSLTRSPWMPPILLVVRGVLTECYAARGQTALQPFKGPASPCRRRSERYPGRTQSRE